MSAARAVRQKRRKRIGLVLGSGSARGWAHIGVIRALAEAHVRPDIVCGCSIGALVGALYADGKLDWLETWVRALDWKGVVRLMDPGWRGGLLGGGRLLELLQAQFGDRKFSGLELPFGAVATDLATGHEVWLREGNLAEAVRASFAAPGLFTPVRREGTFLVDGGVVNPVPVSLARAMGAEIVIAVDLGSDLVSRRVFVENEGARGKGPRNWLGRILPRQGEEVQGTEDPATLRFPAMLDVVMGTINIMQVRIARSRLAGEPADAVISPRLGELGLLEYHRAAECIEEGRSAVARMLPAIRDALTP